MKIKYVKQAPQGMPGDIAEAPDLQAKILIKLKFAEPMDGESSIEFLKNLNGTPVVDNFGHLVELNKICVDSEVATKESVQDIQPIKPKQKRVSKAK
ncbi:hypothetical protein ACK1JC_03840 [Acinetobacter sp. TY2]|uniref:hypothetical protein n=1 Tax=Acinetobacter sp. TY2 TaxID=3387403 RepID=UPI00391784DF